jgi:uncharacterized RDD family membrane protein YckC
MDINSPENMTVVDSYSLANPFERIIAFIIDLVIFGIIHFLLFSVFRIIEISWLGSSIAVFYLILRDNIPFIHYQSIGKKIMKLKVIKANDGVKTNLLISLKRNFIFLPFLFTFKDSFIYPAAVITFFLILIELYLMYTSTDNQRLGDQFAETLVIENYL